MAARGSEISPSLNDTRPGATGLHLPRPFRAQPSRAGRRSVVRLASLVWPRRRIDVDGDDLKLVILLVEH